MRESVIELEEEVMGKMDLHLGGSRVAERSVNLLFDMVCSDAEEEVSGIRPKGHLGTNVSFLQASAVLARMRGDFAEARHFNNVIEFITGEANK